MQKTMKINDKYVLGRELGEGGFGIVYLCTDRKTKQPFACKSIAINKTRYGVADISREISIMALLPRHPNIIRLKEIYEDKETIHLVMELCDGGQLFDRILAKRGFDEPAAANIIRTIAEVLKTCHKHGVMHRDLKAENFLFANDREDAALKLIDFGLSVVFTPGKKFSDIVGSYAYMAPELLKRNYGPEVDIWSAGVILHSLLCGFLPFNAETDQGMVKEIMKGEIDLKRNPWPQVSESAKSLVRQMLESDPKKRLTAQQVLEHPWLQNTKKSSNVPLTGIAKPRDEVVNGLSTLVFNLDEFPRKMGNVAAQGKSRNSSL